MNLIERLADMNDADLAALHANALRLSQGGGPRSRQAVDLLPALEEEASTRKARATEQRATTPAKPRKRRS